MESPQLRKSVSSAEGRSGGKVIYAGGFCGSAMGPHHLALRQPLLDVQKCGCSKIDDGKKLDPEVADYLLLQVIKEMQRFGSCYSGHGEEKGINRELGYRPVVCSIFPIFATLAPRAGELLQGEDPKYRDRHPVGYAHEQAGLEMEMELDGDENLASSFMSDLSGWSFSEGKFRHEDGTDLKPHEAVDVKGYVIDATLPGGEDSVARGLFEMKGLGPWNDQVEQVIYYGSAAAARNVYVGRYKKVHLVVLGLGWAGFAEIDPIGFLDIGPNNVVTPRSVATFQRHAGSKYKLLMKRGKTEEANSIKSEYLDLDAERLASDLKNRIRDRMTKACVKLNNRDSGPYVPFFNKTDRLLVGRASYMALPISMLRYPVNPIEVTAYASASRGRGFSGDMIVVSAIARIVFGDRALRWTLPALLAHASQREREAELEAQKILAAVH